MQIYGGAKHDILVRDNHHDPKDRKGYKGTKSHERFEAKKQIMKEVSNATSYRRCV